MRHVWAVAACVCVLTAGASAQTPPIKGQKPVLMIAGTFRFTPESWGTYVVHDKSTDEYYRMTLSILPKTATDRRPGSWIEIDVGTETEHVVRRALVEETPDGPGQKVFAADVWVEGFTPFSVPEKYLAGEDKEVGQFVPNVVTKRLEVRQVTFAGSELSVFEVEASDTKGAMTRAAVSTSIAPIGLLWADNDELSMFLDDWGAGARTKITQKPIGMFVWIMQLIGRGLSGENVELPARVLPPVDIDGRWEQLDGSCAGAVWTVRGTPKSNSTVLVDSRCANPAVASREPVPLAWKGSRTATLGVGGQRAQNRAVTLMFESDARALVAMRTASGAVELSVLKRRADPR